MQGMANTKLLGVIIDENLNWKNFIQSVCLDLSKIIYKFDKPND